jgi:formate-dependent nitrite reductase membrane component NrfD
VTVEGLTGVRPGREAQVGAHGTTQRAGASRRRRRGDGEDRDGRRRRRARSGRGGERLMVPPAEPVSYYGLPVLNRPVWEARDIAGYLFAGGLSGASSVIGAAASAAGMPSLARASKVTSLVGITASMGLLVHDLGRPERFLNMLRVVKPTSPMSVGTWILTAYGPAAGVAAASAVTGRLPWVGAVATGAAAVTGPAVAAYTAVLLADTAVPAWHETHRELPFVFVGSAALAASGAGLVLAPRAETAPLRRVVALAAATELVASRRMEGHGLVSEPFHTGRAGTLLRAAKVLTVGGTAVATTLAGRSRPAAVVAGAALLAASALTRFGVFAAGVASTEDPKYVVVPQRERLEARVDAQHGGARGGTEGTSPEAPPPAHGHVPQGATTS